VSGFYEKTQPCIPARQISRQVLGKTIRQYPAINQNQHYLKNNTFNISNLIIRQYPAISGNVWKIK
jgi:hypothetical protein